MHSLWDGKVDKHLSNALRELHHIIIIIIMLII